MNDPNAQKMVLAKIGDSSITLGELVEFGKSSPTFYGFLQIPGGPDKLLREYVLEKLLLLEGKARKIPEPANHDKALYLLRIKKELLPDLPPLTEKEAKAYYQTHLEEFSTPLLLRLSQIKIYFTKKNHEEAKAKIERISKELEKGVSFEKLAQQYSEEPISAARGGDIGFVPVSSLSPEDVKKAILKLQIGQITPILKIGNSYTIVKLVDKREPIADPYDKVKGLVVEKAEQARQKERIEALRKQLERKWKVKYLDS